MDKGFLILFMVGMTFWALTFESKVIRENKSIKGHRLDELQLHNMFKATRYAYSLTLILLMISAFVSFLIDPKNFGFAIGLLALLGLSYAIYSLLLAWFQAYDSMDEVLKNDSKKLFTSLILWAILSYNIYRLSPTLTSVVFILCNSITPISQLGVHYIRKYHRKHQVEESLEDNYEEFKA